MRRIFNTELSVKSGGVTELTLPATPYAMLDALEKLQMEDGEKPKWEILQIYDCNSIVPFLDHSGPVQELNALCQQLALLNEQEVAVVEGLARMEHDGDAQSVSLPGLINMAYSTDRCHLVEEAVNDHTLGRFCAENGFVPEVDNLSDEAFELLDFARIGREFRRNEGGVFTHGGYVQKHDEVKRVYGTLDLTPKQPDYAIIVQTASGCEIKLPFPLGETVADEPVQCVDCAAPALIGLSGALATWDMLAHRLTYLTVDSELTKYKAVLDAVRCDDLGRALTLADELDQYTFSPELCDPDEAAFAHLEQILPEQEARRLLPHVNLRKYGQAMIQEMGGTITGYGLIQPNGGEQEHQPAQGGMEGMQ